MAKCLRRSASDDSSQTKRTEENHRTALTSRSAGRRFQKVNAMDILIDMGHITGVQDSNRMRSQKSGFFYLFALSSSILFTEATYAQAGSYGRVVQQCSLTISSRTIPFRCRWMYDGITGGTIFVDNYDTDERYTVENYGWSTVGLIGDGKKACIKSPGGAVACLVK